MPWPSSLWTQPEWEQAPSIPVPTPPRESLLVYVRRSLPDALGVGFTRGISLGLKSFQRRVQGRYSECLGMTQQTDLRVDSAWHHTYTLSIDGVTFGEVLSTAWGLP